MRPNTDPNACRRCLRVSFVVKRSPWCGHVTIAVDMLFVLDGVAVDVLFVLAVAADVSLALVAACC